MKPLTAFFTLVLSLLAFVGSTARAQTNSTWITDVTIISPENLDRIEKGSVLIENGRIAKIERGSKSKPPAGAAIISGKGQYLIPGLIDSHVHLGSIPGMIEEQEQANPAMVKAYFKQMPRSYLYYGYSTLVDLVVSDPGVLEGVRKEPLHPDVYDCGGSLPIANGYPMSFAPPATRFKPFPNFLYDPKQTDKIPAEYKPEEHTPAAAVERVKNSGAICVKTYFERGFAADQNLPVISPEMLAQIRNEATKNGLVLMIHANGFEGQKFAADGNVDVIVHGMWHWGALDKSSALPDEIKPTLDQIVQKRIGYQPTIQVLYGEMAYFDSTYLKMSAVAKVTPPALLAWYESKEGKWLGEQLRPFFNEPGITDEKIYQIFEKDWAGQVIKATAYLAAHNANFIFGTDTPSAPTYGNLPGLNGYMEMHQLHKAGLSLEQIFKAATISNAKAMKLDALVGTIEPGKIANLILMTKSPLQTLDAYDAITTVFIHGQPIPRESLAANPK